MSALTAAAAARIERELARSYEKATVNYTRRWRRISDAPDPHRLSRDAVRLFQRSHDLLALHEVLVARFGPSSSRGHAPQAERMAELVTYVMSLVAVSSDVASEESAKDVLCVILEAMDAE